MATDKGRDRKRAGTRTMSSATPVIEEIVPNSAWRGDPSGHCLLVDLPEFRKEEVKLQVDGTSGRIIVKGKRKINKQKSVHFQLTFLVPTDTDMDNISGNFDGGTFYVYVPKRTSEEKTPNNKVERPEANNVDREKKQIQNENNAHYVYPFSEESDMSRNKIAVNFLRRNKGIVTMAVVAFSIALYIYQLIMLNK